MAEIWAYCRVSTTKEEQEESLEAQESWARRFAAELGCEIVVFKEQASAKTTIGRPIFQSMMSKLTALPKNRRPTHLAITALDRLSRSLRDTLNVVEVLREHKVVLYQRGLGIIGTETFPEKAALAGLSLAGEAENYSRSLRAKQSWERRRSEGKPTSNKVPYGLQLQGERDIPIPESAKWVRRAFQWYAAGDGAFVIARRFAEGAPAHTWLTSRVGSNGERIRKTREGTKWESTRIIKLLKQERYRGSIIEPDLFDRVQERLKNTPHPGSRRLREYPLSGALRCEGCGRHLHGRTCGGRKTYRVVSGEIRQAKTIKRIRYYECYVCNYRLNADVVETRFFKDIEILDGDKSLLESWVAADSKKKNPEPFLRDEISRLERECSAHLYQTRVDRLIDLALDAQFTEGELRRQLERIKEEFASKRARLAELSSKADVQQKLRRSVELARRLLKDFKVLYDCANYDVKRTLVSELTEALGGAITSAEGLKWSRQGQVLNEQLPLSKTMSVRSSTSKARTATKKRRTSPRHRRKRS